MQGHVVQHPTWKADKEALEKGIAETQEKVRKITEEMVTSQQRRTSSKGNRIVRRQTESLKEIQEETVQKEEELERRSALCAWNMPNSTRR